MVAQNNRLFIALIATCSFFGLNAQEHHHAEPSSPEQLGSVSFPISCSEDVQASFERGVALLHSFGYNAARQEFQKIESQDPACAMAYWGDAMAIYRQLWDRPSAKDLSEGSDLIQKAQHAGARTEREREYIQAAAAFYTNDPKATFENRRAAYSQALQKLHEHFPEDDEAAVFYALSLMTSPDANANDFALRKRAVAILNGVFSRRPDHPGAAHYIIHACDNPAMAREGLPAARRYAQIAPASAHALHMPSHIFARLGLWNDDIQSNLASKAAAEQQHGTADRLHAMDFLEYAYLQLGRREQAKAIEEEALQTPQQDYSKDMAFFYWYVQVHFPVLYMVETKSWKDVERLSVPNEPPEYQAVVYWGKAVAAGHLRDVAAAQTAVQQYDAAREAVRKTDYAYVADQMANSSDEVHAWLAFAERDVDEAAKLMTHVADQQDKVGKGEVEIPAREMLADILLESNRPQDAFAQYASSLKTDPNRFNSLYGAARAAELGNQIEIARNYYHDLLQGREQETNDPELAHAKAYLGGY